MASTGSLGLVRSTWSQPVTNANIYSINGTALIDMIQAQYSVKHRPGMAAAWYLPKVAESGADPCWHALPVFPGGVAEELCVVVALRVLEHHVRTAASAPCDA